MQLAIQLIISSFFSYLNYYKANNTAFIFAPKTDSFKEPYILNYDKSDGKRLKILPIDLSELTENSHKFTNNIFKDITNE